MISRSLGSIILVGCFGATLVACTDMDQINEPSQGLRTSSDALSMECTEYINQPQLAIESGNYCHYSVSGISLPMRAAEKARFPVGVYDDGEGRVDYSFLISATPVTYELWHYIRTWGENNGYSFGRNRGSEGSHGVRGTQPSELNNQPLTNISLYEAMAWTNALSEYHSYTPVYTHFGEVYRDGTDRTKGDNVIFEDKIGFRLPTSFEWELAARYRGIDASFGAIEYPPGSNRYWTPGVFASGARASYLDRNEASLVAWYEANSRNERGTPQTQPVAQKPANGNHLGIYDMSGNLPEWTHLSKGADVAIRGGSYGSIVEWTRIGAINPNGAPRIDQPRPFTGMRLVLPLVSSSSPKTQQALEVGDSIEVRYRGTWLGATVLEIKDDSLYIDYDDYRSSWNEWIPRGRARLPGELGEYETRPLGPAPRFEIGASVEVLSGNSWLKAEVLDAIPGRYYISFDGLSSSRNEWVDDSRIRIKSEEPNRSNGSEDDRGSNHNSSNGTDNGSNHDSSNGTDNGSNHDSSNGAANGSNHDSSNGAANGSNHDSSNGADNGFQDGECNDTDNGATENGRDNSGPSSGGGNAGASPVAGRGSKENEKEEEDKTTFDLINEALAEGDIDEETALMYRFFASFGDNRLPEEFEGEIGLGSSFMRDAVNKFDTFTPGTQDTIQPFLLPPSEPGSWMNPETTFKTTRIVWNTIITENDQVKVWWQDRYPNDEAKAHLIADAIDSDIWPKLTELMEREPLSDAGYANNGGDGRLDIYLVRIRHDGLAVPYPSSTNASPTFLLINNAIAQLVETTAHEFMHAIQYSYNVSAKPDDYFWWGEASAVWAEHYVYPDSQSEHRFAPSFLNNTHWTITTSNDVFEYGTYLWPFFLAVTSSPKIVKEIWEATEQLDCLEAMEHVMQNRGMGGFEEQWPQFVKHNLNLKPFDLYKRTDDFELEPWVNRYTAALGSQPHMIYEMEAQTQFLAAHYHRFADFDSNVRSLAFFNGLTFDHFDFDGHRLTMELTEEERRGASVQALIRYEGDNEWEHEDWSDVSVRGFCRMGDQKRLAELIVIFANSEHREEGHNHEFLTPRNDPPILFLSNAACNVWTGSITGTNLQTLEPGVNEGVSIQLTYEALPYNNGQSGFGYKVSHGHMEWTKVGLTESGCTIDGNEVFDLAQVLNRTFNLPFGSVTLPSLSTMNFNDGALNRSIMGDVAGTIAEGPRQVIGNYTEICPERTANRRTSLGHFWFRFDDKEFQEQSQLSPNGMSFSGSGVRNNIGWSWHFSAQ